MATRMKRRHTVEEQARLVRSYVDYHMDYEESILAALESQWVERGGGLESVEFYRSLPRVQAPSAQAALELVKHFSAQSQMQCERMVSMLSDRVTLDVTELQGSIVNQEAALDSFRNELLSMLHERETDAIFSFDWKNMTFAYHGETSTMEMQKRDSDLNLKLNING